MDKHKKLFRAAGCLLIIAMLAFPAPKVDAAAKINNEKAQPDLAVEARVAVLLDVESGKFLYEQNSHEELPPASVTKVMTILLIVEALERGDITLDEVITCSAHASSMGGSQVYLKEGEQMTLHDMLKSIVVSSANDAAVAVAEHIR